MTGEIVEALRNGMFRIQLDNGHETLGYTAGKMRRFRIRMNPGDRVRIELRLDRGSVVEAKFTANACALCVAAASVLTELAKADRRP